jgi:hypothetical protein
MAAESDVVAPEAQGASQLETFVILHVTASTPTPCEPITFQRQFQLSRAPGRFGTGLPDSMGTKLSTEHFAEGCSLCRGAEDRKPERVIAVMGWFVKGIENYSVMVQ